MRTNFDDSLGFARDFVFNRRAAEVLNNNNICEPAVTDCATCLIILYNSQMQYENENLCVSVSGFSDNNVQRLGAQTGTLDVD